jgi:hypothetical protein
VVWKVVKLSDVHSAVAPGKSRARSRVSNGSTQFLDSVDGRSALARRYRDILADLSSDLGGNLSAAKLMICRRAATIAVWCEQVESKMAEGDEINVAEFTTASNALRRLLADLGLERKAKDVTPDLQTYLQSKGRVAA